MLPLRAVVFVQEVPPAEAYCTDHPARLTGLEVGLKSSMKSFLKVAPAFPPPPYTWLMTTCVTCACKDAAHTANKMRQSRERRRLDMTVLSPQPQSEVWCLADRQKQKSAA